MIFSTTVDIHLATRAF